MGCMAGQCCSPPRELALNTVNTRCATAKAVGAIDATDQCCKIHDYDSGWPAINWDWKNVGSCPIHKRMVQCMDSVPYATV